MNIGLIFGVIFAIVLIGLLLVFGYQQIVQMQHLQQIAQIKRAMDDLQTATERVYSLGGESAEKFTFSLPGGVSKVCFIFRYEVRNGQRVDHTGALLKNDLYNIIDADINQKWPLAEALYNQRIKQLPGHGIIDDNYTVLVFFHSTIIPQWYHIEHLEPVKDPMDEAVLCVSNNEEFWLQRKYDQRGAWVDVEKV